MDGLCLPSPIGAQIVIVGRCAEGAVRVGVQGIKAVVGVDAENAEPLTHTKADDLRSRQPGGFEILRDASAEVRPYSLAGQWCIQISTAEQMNTALEFIFSADKQIVAKSSFNRN